MLRFRKSSISIALNMLRFRKLSDAGNNSLAVVLFGSNQVRLHSLRICVSRTFSELFWNENRIFSNTFKKILLKVWEQLGQAPFLLVDILPIFAQKLGFSASSNPVNQEFCVSRTFSELFRNENRIFSNNFQQIILKVWQQLGLDLAIVQIFLYFCQLTQKNKYDLFKKIHHVQNMTHLTFFESGFLY